MVILWTLFANILVVIGPAVGPAFFGGPFAWPLVGGCGGRMGPGVAPGLSLLQAGCGGLGSVAPARGM